MKEKLLLEESWRITGWASERRPDASSSAQISEAPAGFSPPPMAACVGDRCGALTRPHVIQPSI